MNEDVLRKLQAARACDSAPTCPERRAAQARIVTAARASLRSACPQTLEATARA